MKPWLSELRRTRSLTDVKDSSRFLTKLVAFKNIAVNVSSLSYDDKCKVGTIIVSEDFRDIAAIGYNGNYKGGPNKRESLDIGQSGFLHSEENALIHLDIPYALRDSLFMLCTHKPCPMCAKRIVNAGINVVFYIEEYDSLGNQADEIFKDADVICIKV